MIRRAGAADLGVTWDIYRDAVLNGTGEFYTPEQARAWVGDDVRPNWWADRMSACTTWLHEGRNGPDGFISLTEDRHLDFFFTRPSARGTDAARLLYAEMLGHAAVRGFGRLTTFSSLYARRFLEPRGWKVTSEESVIRNGLRLSRFAMELDNLSQGSPNQVS